MANFLFKKVNSDEEYKKQFSSAKAAIDSNRPLTNFEADTLGIMASSGDKEAKDYILKAFEMYEKMKESGVVLEVRNRRAKARISHLFRYFFLNIRGFKNPNHRYDYKNSKKAILEGIVER